MSSTMTKPAPAVPAFSNEAVTDFSRPANREAMEKALAEVHAQLGRDYDLRVAGRRESTPDKLKSLNPSRPKEVVGIHSKATAALATEAVELAYAYYPVWSATPAETRAEMLLKASALIKKRKLEFDAWLVYEAGKTWPKRTRTSRRRLISASITRVRCCVSASPIRWCRCRAKKTRCTICR